MCQFGESFRQRRISNFAFEEFLEFAVIRFFGIKAERILALFFKFRVITEEIPVPACDRQFFFFLTLTHALADTVIDTRAIRNNYGRAVVSFRFGHGLHELVLIGTHSYLRYIYIAVRNGHHAEILLLRAFTGSGKLCNSGCRRSLGGLAARIGVNFRVEDEDVDVLILREHMVHAAEADIISPAVAAEDPVGTFDEVFLLGQEFFKNRFACRFFFEKGRHFIGAFTCAFPFEEVGCPVAERGLKFGGSNRFCGFNLERQVFADLVDAHEHAETVFRGIFKQAVGPDGTVAFFVRRIRGHRRGTAVNGGAARSVGDHHAVAEKLSRQFDIRCFAAACTSTGEFKERLFELRTDNGLLILRIGFRGHFVLREVPQIHLTAFVVIVRDHGKRLGRADIGTAAAFKTVELVNDDGETVFFAGFSLGRNLEARRRLGTFLFGRQNGTDGRMRADKGALCAADTLFMIPGRNI